MYCKMTDSINIVVTYRDVLNYCQALGKDSSVYECGKGKLRLPGTYPILFWQYIDVPWLENMNYPLQTNQTFSYERSLYTDTVYTCYIILENQKERDEEVFLSHKLLIEDKSDIVATCQTMLCYELEGVSHDIAK